MPTAERHQRGQPRGGGGRGAALLRGHAQGRRDQPRQHEAGQCGEEVNNKVFFL